MNYDKIYYSILSVYQECQVFSFPVDCLRLVKTYTNDCIPYSKLPSHKQKVCMTISTDAFLYQEIVYYNDKIRTNRQRFSLMHELGHVMLKHAEHPTETAEQEANAFASHILAPRIAIHYAGCRNEADVARIFHLTGEASRYAFDNYRRWRRYLTYYHMGEIDQALFKHFYSEEYGCFVWNRKICYSDEHLCINHSIDCSHCAEIHRTPAAFHTPSLDSAAH